MKPSIIIPLWKLFGSQTWLLVLSNSKLGGRTLKVRKHSLPLLSSLSSLVAERVRMGAVMRVIVSVNMAWWAR